MNPYCQCDGPGFCERHQINKNQRHFELCKGIATDKADCGFHFWQAWEKGLFQAKVPENPILEKTWECNSERALVAPTRGKRAPVPERVTRTVPKFETSWTYGVTTVNKRLNTTLPITLKSLANAGFENPWIFIDGVRNYENVDYLSKYRCSVRYPLIKTFGNWILGLWELYIRNPQSDRYVMFQDDFITYHNLRDYLESCQYPEAGYWNLYTFPENQKLCKSDKNGWYLSNQRGKGALALVFNRDAVLKLLASRASIVDRPLTVGRRAWSNIDGGIVTALGLQGWKEYVHNPSLVQHIGDISSMGGARHPKAVSFRGEEFDARKLMESAMSQVGSVLAEKFRKFGIVPTKGCSCKKLEKAMNRASEDEIELNVEYWIDQLIASARKWRELKGGIWKTVMRPPRSLCEKVILDACKKSREIK
jgi:hypothetical protein